MQNIYRCIIIAAIAGIITCIYPSVAQYDVKNFAVMIKSTIDTSGTKPKVILSWQPDSDAKLYVVYRKLKTDSSFGNSRAALQSGITTFVDSTVKSGIGYEYKIKKIIDADNEGFGYVYTGYDLPAIEYRGKVLVLVDYTVTAALSAELSRLEKDLVGDGWRVEILSVPRAERFNPKSVQIVKEIIEKKRAAEPNDIKSVMLVGKVPAPYSGEYAIDGHINDHYGAWPADLYYGVFDCQWTDSSAYTESALDSRNFNIPYDGKFDQVFFDGNVSLEIGRIDMFDLNYFPETETELLRRYFDKNHNFRHCKIKMPKKAIIDDKFKLYSNEAFAANAWSEFSSVLGYDAIVEGNLIDSLPKNSYLWAYGCNQGAYNSILYVAYADLYASQPQNCIFLLLFGSLLGDWDSKDNIMRSGLASNPSVLASAWAGRPYWHFHQMALGATIGYSALITQNNFDTYPARGYHGNHLTHIALLGDPTLRMSYIEPPSDLRIGTDDSDKGKILRWQPSAGEVVGYNVYRAKSIKDRFTKINADVVKADSFKLDASEPGNSIYMVRAIGLEHAASGSYYNLSQGIFYEDYLRIIYRLPGISIYSSPNPASTYTELTISGSMPAVGEISIYSFTGNIVNKFSIELKKNGSTTIAWDLRDSDGDKVMPGVYVVQVRSAGLTGTCKLLVMP